MNASPFFFVFTKLKSVNSVTSTNDEAQNHSIWCLTLKSSILEAKSTRRCEEP